MSVFIGYPSFMAYQMMKGKKGNNDGFPSIPGMIARYSALGLTNEQMATNPVWVDKTGNGHDLQLKNFAWKEGSGISDVYLGALVFDGVDDYGTCNNFPILTKEKGYTVVALRQWIEEKNSITALVSNSKNWNQDGAFVFEYNNLENNYPNLEISFGSNTGLGREKSSFTYQTSKLYNGKEIKFGEFLGSDRLTVAKANENLSSNSNVAIWELVFLDHDATEEELTKIKDYFVKTYPWLFPDQAWTVVGKTNEDKDRATITNITGNGNDLVLSNFGFIEGSGYNEEGEYAGYLVTDGVDDKIQSSNFPMGKDFTVVGEWKMLKNSDTYELAGINKYDSFILYNYSYNNRNRINVYIHSGQGTPINTDSIKAFTSTGLIYIDNFNNVEEVIPRDKTDRGYTLFIGYNNNVFTKLAFKNLAIYSEVLSKEDCIKAYNYLQTLKAK